MEQHRHEIVIKSSDLAKKKTPISGSKTDTDQEKASGGLLSKEDAKTFMAGYTAYKQAKNFATQIVAHNVSMVELRTGSRELQERANFQLQVRQQVIGVAETALTGLAAGGLPGATVGTLIGVVNTAVHYIQRAEEINLKRSIENRTIETNLVRAGTGGSRRNYD